MAGTIPVDTLPVFPYVRLGGRRPTTVLITGAGSGIGSALAHWYAGPGRVLLLIDHRPIEGPRRPHSGDVRTATADVRDPERLREVIAQLTGGLPIDRVVHCAGVLPGVRPLARVDPAEVAVTVDVNLVGSFNVAHAVLPHLRAGSHLVLVASLGGLVAGYRYAAYSSSKFGVVGLAETLRMELAQDGVITQVVCPGEVSTPMVSDEIEAADLTQRALKRLSGPPIAAERAATLIGRGIESGRFFVIPTTRAKLVWWCSRLVPTGVRHRVTDRVIRNANGRAARR